MTALQLASDTNGWGYLLMLAVILLGVVALFRLRSNCVDVFGCDPLGFLALCCSLSADKSAEDDEDDEALLRDNDSADGDSQDGDQDKEALLSAVEKNKDEKLTKDEDESSRRAQQQPHL